MKKKLSLRSRALLLLFFVLSTFSFSQTNTWDPGFLSTNWGTASNWSLNVVPTSAHDVIVPSVSGFGYSYPQIGAITANAKSVTINTGATLTLASASSLLNIKENFTNNGTLSAGAASTIAFDGTVGSIIGGSSAINFGNLTINKSANATTVTNGSSSLAFAVQGVLNVTRGNLILAATNLDYTIADNLTVATNGSLTHNVNWDTTSKLISVGGHLNIQGAYSYTGRTHVQMNGSTKNITTGTSALSILTMINPSGTTISAIGPVTVNDNFWSSFGTAGTFATGVNMVTANGVLLVAGGVLNVNGGNLNVTGGLNVGFQTANGTVNFSSGTLNVDALNIGDATRTGVFNHTGGTANFGDVVINAPTGNSYICSTTGPQIINVRGDWTNNRIFTDGTASTVNFTGTGARLISGVLSGTNGSFYNLTFNGVGGSWTNNAPIQVANTLTMTNGILNTTMPANIISVTRAGTTAALAITGGNDNSYVNGPLLWSLRPGFSGVSTYNFPVGKGGRYLPFFLVNPAIGSGTVTAQAEAFSSNSGGTPNFLNPTTTTTLGGISDTEYWSLATAGNFTNSSVSIARPDAIVPYDNIAGSTSAAGVYSSLGGTVGANGITGSTSINTSSPTVLNRFFTFGRRNGIRINGAISTPICASSAVNVPFVVTGAYTTGNVFTAQLSNASGSFATPTPIGNLTLNLSGGTGSNSSVIPSVIPSGTPSGTGYRIRVVSSVPDVVGENNGVNITINAINTAAAPSSSPTLCINTALPSAITIVTTGATGINVPGITGLPVGVTATFGSNTITLTGTPTASGTFNYTIPLTGGCGTVNATGTITVTANMTAAAPSSSPTLCINTALPSPITISTTGATGINVPGITGLPAGVTASFGSNTITLTGTPTASGTFNYTIPLTGGCGTVNATGTITVTANMTAGAASSSPTVCIGVAIPTVTIPTTRATGINVPGITGLPAGVTASFGSNTITLTGTPTASGTFNYTIPLTGGCGTVNATGTITVTANMTAGTASSSPTLCINTALPSAITIVTTGATGINVPGITGLPAGVTASFGSNTITLTGTPTVSGTFNYTIPLTGGCGTVNATGTITVTANMTAGVPSSSPTLCINTALPSAITIVTTGATGINVPGITGLPAGVTASFGSNTITLTGTPTASGTFNYSIPLTGGCGTVNATGTIAVTAANTFTVSSGTGSNNQSVCIGAALPEISFITTGATSIGLATGLPAGVTATFASNTITISGTPTGSGVFNYSIPLLGGCGTANATGVIKINAPTVYNGTWSDGLPDGSRKVIFASGYTSSAGEHINACSCEIQSSATLRIGANSSLTVQNEIINSGLASNFIIETDGNLLQINPSKLINSGSITAERTLTGLRYDPTATVPAVDFVYWGSPVTGQPTTGSGGFSPGTLASQFADYRESNNRFYGTTDTSFIPGKGYSVQAERNKGTSYSETYRFRGAPNNGDFTTSLLKSATGSGYNLVANPYPSNINFNELYTANAGLIWNTAWFWTNATYQPYQQGSGYSGNNYAIFNGTGGVPATSPYAGGVSPNGIVKVGQGFMVQAKVGGNLEFKNSYSAGHDLRVSNSGPFVYKNANEKNRYTLKLVAPTTLVNTQLIGYVQGATNGFEKDYDASSFGLTSDLFYSVVGNSRLLIQGRDAHFVTQDKVALGVNFFQTGTYTIELGAKEGIFANGQNIYLKDRQNNVVTNLSQGSYTFAATSGDNNSRFEIIYEPETILATDEKGKDQIIVYRENGDFVIQSSKEIERVEVYDPSGKLVKALSSKSKRVVIDSSALINGMYILKIKTRDGAIFNKKIVK